MASRRNSARDRDAVIGVAFRRSLVVLGTIFAVATVAAALLRLARPGEEVLVKDLEMPEPILGDDSQLPRIPFTDITAETGITFNHVNGATGEKLLPETMGSGVAVLDADNDGDQDLLFVNSDLWPWARPVSRRPTMALYANTGNGTFEDVTAASGLSEPIYGMGAAVGDIDNDGDRDLFISALGRNRLFVNHGGRFSDATEAAGVGGSEDAWSTASGFFDADNDGDLDLFVGNYVAWSREIDFEVGFTLNGIDRAYGPPTSFAGTFPYLYRNDGSGRFEEVSLQTGLHITNPSSGQAVAKCLGVTFADVDGDGRLDILVGNDTVRNFLFMNQPDGRFEEVGTVAGLAFDSSGLSTGAMGVDAAEYRNDGHLAVVVANFANEMASFFVAQENPGQFADQTMLEGIGSPSRLHLGFGTFFFDADLDGRLDLLIANGHIEDTISQVQASQSHRQSAQLFWNTMGGSGPTFAPLPRSHLEDLAVPVVGRGAAYADFDQDGDLDVVLTTNGGRPVLLRNDQASENHWLRITLIGSQSNRDAIGAAVEVQADGVRQRRYVMPTRSYLSQVELPLTFGLGNSDGPITVSVRWPDGSMDIFEGLEADCSHVLRQ
jgi:hypothetical protein